MKPIPTTKQDMLLDGMLTSRATRDPARWTHWFLWTSLAAAVAYSLFVVLVMETRGASNVMLTVAVTAILCSSIIAYSVSQTRIQNRQCRAERKTAEILALRTAELASAKSEVAAANAVKDHILTNMSHEIRTPINSILGLTDLILSTELTAEQRECLELARYSGRNLLTLVNDFLDYSSAGAGRIVIDPQDTDIRQLVGRTVDALVAGNVNVRVPVNWTVDDDVPVICRLDAMRVRQILTNLLGNAIKFTRAGEIRVRIGCLKLPDGGFMLTGEVVDTGIGIPADKIESIFGEWVQGDDSVARRPGGVGLGLAITQRLCRLMGGQVSATSTQGEGSVFQFFLKMNVPLPAPVVTPAAKAQPASVLSCGLDILVVEDNKVNATVVERLLKRKGHRVVVAENGRLGVEAYARAAFDLVLMDVQMPEMDGLEATQAIREREKVSGVHTAIVALTAHASDEDRDRCLKSGMDDYLTKPLRMAMLDSVLDSLTAARVC